MAEQPQLREAPENFLESMLAAQEADGVFTDEEIIGNTFTLLLAGEDTTAHTMAWTIWLLASRPEVQARCAQEADAILGGERFPVTYESVGSLRYSEAVLRESMRLKPVAPVIGVEPLADTTVMGTRIPAGTPMLLLTRHASLRAGGFERASEFDPERWLADGDDAPPAHDSKGVPSLRGWAPLLPRAQPGVPGVKERLGDDRSQLRGGARRRGRTGE